VKRLPRSLSSEPDAFRLLLYAIAIAAAIAVVAVIVRAIL
jgi:hypothetical protein